MPPSMRATEHQLSPSHQRDQTDNFILPDSPKSSIERAIFDLDSPFAASNSPAFIDASSAPAHSSRTVSDPDSRHPPVSLNRRSTSINDIRNGVGNLNRWSESTTSSRASSAHHQRSSSFSRRMSVGGSHPTTAGAFATPQSPTKPQKAQGYTFESLPRRSASASNRKRSSGVLPGLLPPLITIPPLQESLGNSPQGSTFIQTPSTAAVISAVAHQTNPDYFGRALDNENKRLSPGALDINTRRPSAASIHTVHSANSPALVSTVTSESKERGHSRHRSQSGKSSEGTDSSSKSKDKTQKLSQKAMLSKALQKANTAVLLDNAQNFEGAVQAYSEACALLQQVMIRSSGNDDKRKLEAIRNTYTSRINELNKITPQFQADEEKALPARPQSKELQDDELRATVSEEEGDEPAIVSTATVTRIVNDHSYYTDPPQSQNTHPSQRRQSQLQSTLDPAHYSRRHTDQQNAPSRSFSKSPMRDIITERRSSLAPPMENEYMPPPLSPRRPSSPTDYDPVIQQTHTYLNTATPAPTGQGHLRNPSSESMSWLDTIDESGGSTTSSVHSRTSSFGMRRKHIRSPSGATEAEFDAALDAAVEAAYDDGFEPFGEAQQAEPAPYEDDMMSNVRRKVELAKELVRQTQRESAIQYAHEREKSRRLQESRQQDHEGDIYEGNESDEEERMLDEMTREYHMDDFEFGLQSKSALPRESDSSGFSGRTWNSSIGSNPAASGTTLSPVTETSSKPQLPSLQSRNTPPLVHPPPIHALPPPPTPGGASTAQPYPPPSAPLPIPTMSSSLPITGSILASPAKSVRSRRLSGQNATQLKIETVGVQSPDEPGPPSKAPPKIPQLSASAIPKTAGLLSQQRGAVSGNKAPPIMFTRQTSSPFPGPTHDDVIPPSLALTQTMSDESENGIPRSGSPGRSQSRGGGLRKNFSATSLKTMKSRNLSISGMEDLADVSPNTPGGHVFPIPSRESKIPAIPALPTPIATAFKDKMNGMPSGGYFLFDSDIHSPEAPGSPNPLNNNSPIPLEPCPAEHLLRPFWLMRAVYQTIAHPRGGYLSTKLFVPRDVWRVKNVKLKGLEDKISQCDYLTAALLKLGKVDTNDADAVLEEMQSLETVLEQVQAVLTKKLGNEVGPQGAAGFFKDANATTEPGSDGAPKSAVAAKSSSFSWKRLRSKNSAMGLTNNYASKTSSMDGAKESHTMSTLPMTSLATIRFAKRDVNSVQFTGPNANYMGSLAKLFDAAQVIDQIARQVEDPGLRHADKTQVGLELSTRHAAEFFGFYICKFVLTDITMLLDKFIKRGTEWVMV